MDNPYIQYYSNQAGSGITGYSGSRYHVGRGFFGKILKNLKPALKYIGKQGWDAFNSLRSDIANGSTFEDAGKNALLKTTQNVLSDANIKLEQYKKRKQTGGGLKRRKKSKTTRRVIKKPKRKVYKRKKPKSKKKKIKKVYKKRKHSKKFKIINSLF